MNEQFVRERITELRIKKNVSEYRMSLELGHSNSYIRSITSGKALPSMAEFLYICEYLGVTPRDFFDERAHEPQLVEELTQAAGALPASDLTLLVALAHRMAGK